MNNQKFSYLDLLSREMQIRNYSQRTIKTYGTLMSALEKTVGCPLDLLTVEQFKDYLYQQITIKKVSVSTVNQSISAFKILQVDVLKKTWEDFKIKRPRREKKLPVILSQNEVESLIVATKNIKYKTLLMLTYSAGLRKMEVLQLRASAIDSQRMQIHVHQGKGKKDRFTILSHKALEMLRVYYKLERPAQYLFEAQGSKGKALSESTLNKIIKESAKKAGIKKDISFHTLRHCFATHLLENGVNLRLIQEFMGHNSIKTTSIYLHVAQVNIASVISPLDRMNV